MAGAGNAVSSALFGPQATSPAEARRFVRILCHGSVPDDIIDVAVLLTSELVTNGVVHGHCSVRVEVGRSESELRVSVSDGGDGVPLVQPHAGAGETGRGLALGGGPLLLLGHPRARGGQDGVVQPGPKGAVTCPTWAAGDQTGVI